ncbi:MAG: hypothetical protein UU58_C0010G0011 [Candidatus Nomurabacteria bacterium GW2011_GWA2_41_25]|uniref:Uncharacterized protein n=2 Tax=Candidatus Nomuraibacteriota TaxID=1752729 RepID=A0A1F6YA16_9BACT|nr:MAG: hypothetical protein UU58_C0010G0011 [Candidatus Nomurabacteria bacterium GW2011_GWA2_41_25]OGI67623.1 MAG: hypothetical protein A2823_00245 [Candidatus Nomurabacteria bacterium RIFCSPHIGHO2_01_FULL_41_91]OGI84801.1 MAG: hypothetical protein A3F49_03575 [Candidatus Nomurabacteria bacterium RIFCSPHIGHO2_12_FULL_42_19]OGI94262.1 MAG: hypothetical protein A3A07_01775 [Candidatus Nomurabacteria bacterium RIFCSPLOWO2_01_FULL_41_52]OGI97962.1 MAG: hypothetical protein A3H56_01685 [Candidatus 
MKKLILALVVMLLCGLSVALESSEKKDTIEGLKNALSTLDQYDFSVPVGIDSGACRAYWRMNSFQDILKRYQVFLKGEQERVVRAKKKANARGIKYTISQLGDPFFEQALKGRIREAAQTAMNLFEPKLASGEILGCGGKEISDEWVLFFTQTELTKKKSPVRIGGKK